MSFYSAILNQSPFIYLIYFWLRWVLVAAHGIFVEAYAGSFVAVHVLFVVVGGLLSSCGVWAFSLP